MQQWIEPQDRRTIMTLGLLTWIVLSFYVFWIASQHGGLRQLEHPSGELVRYQVDINSADWIEYALLPGIGEKTARAIVDWREEHGHFESIDQLDDVRGIGPRTLERIRQYLVAGPGGC